MSITARSRVPVAAEDERKIHDELIENLVGLPEAGAGKPINEDDVIAAAALVPIGGVKFTPEELRIVRAANISLVVAHPCR